MPCVFTGVLGGSKQPASISVNGAGEGSMSSHTTTSTAERSASSQTSKTTDSSFSMLGLSLGHKTNSESSSSSDKTTKVHKRVISMQSQALTSEVHADRVQICDDDAFCLAAYPQHTIDSLFQKRVMQLPVTEAMLQTALLDIQERAKDADSRDPHSSTKAAAEMLGKMPPGLRQVYYEFLT